MRSETRTTNETAFDGRPSAAVLTWSDQLGNSVGEAVDFGRVNDPISRKCQPTKVLDRGAGKGHSPKRVQQLVFEAIIVDEGQDFEADWFDILRLLLRPEAYILWLEDPDQAIRHLADDRNLAGERFEAEGFIGYRTKANYRSPQSIAAYIAERLPIFDFVAANPLPGLGVREREYRSR